MAAASSAACSLARSIYRERRKARGATSEAHARRIGEVRRREVMRKGPPKGKKQSAEGATEQEQATVTAFAGEWLDLCRTERQSPSYAGVPRYGPHALRHSLGTRLMLNGASARARSASRRGDSRLQGLRCASGSPPGFLLERGGAGATRVSPGD